MVELWPILTQGARQPHRPAARRKRSRSSKPGTPPAATGATWRTRASTNPAPTNTTTRSRSWTPGGRNCSKLSSSPRSGTKRSPRLHGMLEFGAPEPGAQPTAPDFADGWYGYVSKDLRDVLAAGGEGSRAGRPVLAALLRRGLAERLPHGAAGLASRSALGDAAADLRPRRVRRRPAGELLRHEPLRQRERDLVAAVPVPEPPHLPAGGRADGNAAPLTPPSNLPCPRPFISWGGDVAPGP